MRFAISLPSRLAVVRLAAIEFAVVTLALCLPACAEMAPPIPTRGSLPSHVVVQSAGMIFSGTVLKVEHMRSAGFPGVTQITFRVESAVRGLRRGQSLTIREWEGLWDSGERYRTGERVVLFLYPPSKLGLTSPVGGALGRYEIDHAGRVLVGGAGPRPKPIHVEDFTSEIRRAAQER